MKKKIKTFLFISAPIFLILHFLGWWRYYYDLNGYDKLVHFLAGASVVLVICWILEETKINKNRELVSLVFLFLIALVWETFEYFCDHILGRPIINPLQLGWFDTLTDFLADFGGGILVLIILRLKRE